jgi:hypothetical protein
MAHTHSIIILFPQSAADGVTAPHSRWSALAQCTKQAGTRFHDRLRIIFVVTSRLSSVCSPHACTHRAVTTTSLATCPPRLCSCCLACCISRTSRPCCCASFFCHAADRAYDEISCTAVPARVSKGSIAQTRQSRSSGYEQEF